MPVYKDTPQNRKLKRVGKSYGYKATKKPKKQAKNIDDEISNLMKKSDSIQKKKPKKQAKNIDDEISNLMKTSKKIENEKYKQKNKKVIMRLMKKGMTSATYKEIEAEKKLMEKELKSIIKIQRFIRKRNYEWEKWFEEEWAEHDNWFELYKKAGKERKKIQARIKRLKGNPTPNNLQKIKKLEKEDGALSYSEDVLLKENRPD